MFKAIINNLKTNILRTVLICALPVLLYFIMGPLTVYALGLMGKHFYLSDFYIKIVAIGLIFLLIGSVLVASFPKKANGFILALIGYVGIMSYIQDMFLNIKLAENDGSPMKWQELSAYTRINACIWLVVFIVVVFLWLRLKDKLIKILMYISAFVGAVLLVTWATVFAKAIKDEDMLKSLPTYSLVGDRQYTVASDNNVIVFVVDTYGSNQLARGLEADEHLLDGFNDFIYYTNADSCYFRTFPSMTHMLTTLDVDFDQSMDDYKLEAWTSQTTNDIYTKIHDCGYQFYLYSTGGTDVYGDAVNMSGHIDNAREVTFNVDKKAAFIRLLKISVYKYVPYVAKPSFEIQSYLFDYIASVGDASDINCGNTLYYADLVDGLSIDSECENAVIIQHLDGTHEPYVTNALCEADDNADLISTQQGIIRELERYISELKRLGLYDKATIIITADHSSWGDSERGMDPQIVYLVKPAMNHQDQLTINTAPISHDDFMPTILDIVGADYSEYGRSIFDISEDESRERTIVNQEYDDSYPRVPGCVSNIYSLYTYTGDLDDIIYEVENVGPLAVYPIVK